MASQYEHYKMAEEIMGRFDTAARDAKQFLNDIKEGVSEDNAEEMYDIVTGVTDALRVMCASAQVHATLATYSGGFPVDGPVKVPEAKKTDSKKSKVKA